MDAVHIPYVFFGAGEEAYWLMNCVSAIRRCIPCSPDGPASEPLFRELATSIRLATKRISLISLERFAGKNKVGLSREGTDRLDRF